MNVYRLNPEQLDVIERITALADSAIAPRAAQTDEEGRFPSESMRALAEAGFWGLTVSPDYGGMGHGLRMTAAAVDTVAQRCASTAMVYLMHLFAGWLHTIPIRHARKRASEPRPPANT